MNDCHVPSPWHWNSSVPVPHRLCPGVQGPTYVQDAPAPESVHWYPGVQSVTLRTGSPPAPVTHHSICVDE